MRASLHREESARLNALRSFGVLDTPREADFDEIVQLAAQICEAPISVINLIDASRQWFKAEVGLGIREMPLDNSICAHAILEKGLVVVPDTGEDARFADNRLVTSLEGIRFYAGTLLETEEGLPIGTLCILDTKPRDLNALQRDTLRVLGRQVMAQLELRKKAKEFATERGRFRELLDEVPAHVVTMRGPELQYEFTNQAFRRFIGRDVEGKPLKEVWPEIPDGHFAVLRSILESGESFSGKEAPVAPPDDPARLAYFDFIFQPLREADDSISGIFVHSADVTDQVAARRELAESEARFRLGQRAGRVGTFEWLIPEDRVVWSPELESLYGVPEGTFEGTFSSWAGRVESKDVERVEAQIQTGLAHGIRGISYEFRAVLPSGQHRWLAGQAEFEYDEAGKPLRMAGVNVDIHARKQAEASLSTSEERFRIVAQATRDAVWDWDVDAGTVWWSEGVSDLSGKPMESVSSSPEWWSDRIHPDDRERVVASLWKFVGDGATNWQQEYRFLYADGTYLVIDDRGYAIKDESDRTVRMIGAMSDVTRERQSVARLAFLRDLTEATVEIRDPTEIIETAERLMGEYLGVSRCAYAEVEADENTFTMWDWCRDLPSAAGTYPLQAFGGRAAATMRGGETLVIHDVDAEVAPEEGADTFNAIGVRAIVCCPLIKGGKLAAMMAVHQKVARRWSNEEVALVEQVVDRMWAEIERARAEERLREANEELEERVAERTEQLQAAIKESEAFNYSISHDLRAPLRSIVATSRILLEDLEATLDAEHLKQLERQAHNATRLGVLIDELLRLSRLGRVEVHRTEMDLTELVEELVVEMERANMTQGCRIEVQPGMRAKGDPRLVRLVYSNLLENACKFSPEGGRVWVGHAKRGEDDVFSVQDEGVGFDMAYAHKLFLPFERLVTEAEFPGTGIGLANVERIVRRHGGHVWAESEPGRGASFYFTLA
ncbi:hypothetical protein BH11ARM2_BH11ARM2_37910 [soil metagenome]